jgi:arylformamidase
MLAAPGRVIDLTQTVTPSMPVAIGFPPVEMYRVIDLDRGDVATVEILSASLHAGTHVDAPGHFVRGAPMVDTLDPRCLIGSAVVIDVPAGDDWVPIEARTLTSWETSSGEHIDEGDIVLLRSGHAARWWRPRPEGDEYMLRPWPHLVTSAIDLLLERKVRAVGVECADPDRVDQRDLASSSFEGHKRLLAAGILIIENLANLAEIPVARFQFVALPLRIAGGSASPLRALAFLEA